MFQRLLEDEDVHVESKDQYVGRLIGMENYMYMYMCEYNEVNDKRVRLSRNVQWLGQTTKAIEVQMRHEICERLKKRISGFQNSI